jgi:hypothetical protein
MARQTTRQRQHKRKTITRQDKNRQPQNKARQLQERQDKATRQRQDNGKTNYNTTTTQGQYND